MIEIFWFLLLSLGVWRISSLLAFEDGPFDMFAKLRHLVGVRYDEYSQPTIYKNTFAKGIVCLYCNSLWVAIPFSFLVPRNIFFSPFYSVKFHTILIWFVTWLSLSAMAILFNELVDLLARASRR